MKKAIKFLASVIIIGVLITSCSKKQEQSLEGMIKDGKNQDKILTMIVENHDLSKKYIDKILENNHTTGMVVDGLVLAASKDSVLAGKISDMIIKYPDLVLATMHHFMPVINTDEHMGDGFCDQAMEQPKIVDKMCHKMKASKKMSCCH